jgi:hypothetical protein
VAAARDAAAAIKPSAVDIATRDGARIAESLRQRRLRAIAGLKQRAAPQA